jgi:hypothetical protein
VDRLVKVIAFGNTKEVEEEESFETIDRTNTWARQKQRIIERRKQQFEDWKKENAQR